MDLGTLTGFFMWCTILNGAMLVLWSVFFLFAQDMTYRMQSRFVTMPRETWNVVMYSFLGLFKVVYIVFNVVPFVALKLMA